MYSIHSVQLCSLMCVNGCSWSSWWCHVLRSATTVCSAPCWALCSPTCYRSELSRVFPLCLWSNIPKRRVSLHVKIKIKKKQHKNKNKVLTTKKVNCGTTTKGTEISGWSNTPSMLIVMLTSSQSPLIRNRTTHHVTCCLSVFIYTETQSQVADHQPEEYCQVRCVHLWVLMKACGLFEWVGFLVPVVCWQSPSLCV